MFGPKTISSASQFRKSPIADARFGDHAVGVAAGVVSAAGVGVVARQIVGDGVDHPLRHLRAAGAIQKNGGMAVHRLCERRELRANPGEIEGSGGRRCSAVGIGQTF